MQTHKMLKYLLLLPALLIFGSAWSQQGSNAPDATSQEEASPQPMVSSQQGNDMIVLWDRSYYRGTIIEKIPDKHIKIMTLDGRVLTFALDNVKRFRINPSRRSDGISKPMIQVKDGYFNNTDFGLMLGARSWGGIGVRPSVSTINGYQFDRYSFGVGVGLASFDYHHYVPVFLDSRVYLRKDAALSPYVALQTGCGFGLTPINNGYWDIWPEPEGGRVRPNGLHGAVQLGLRKYTSNRFGINFSMGARMQRSKTTYTDYFWVNGEDIPVEVTEVSRMVRGEFRFGIFFN